MEDSGLWLSPAEVSEAQAATNKLKAKSNIMSGIYLFMRFEVRAARYEKMFNFANGASEQSHLKTKEFERLRAAWAGCSGLDILMGI